MSKYGVFSSPYFPAFTLNTRDTPFLFVFSPSARKYGPEKHFSLNLPFSANQTGFKLGAFSLDQLSSKTNKISPSFDEKYEVRDAFPDKSKIFDKV